MRPISYLRPDGTQDGIESALRAVATDPGSHFLAGGTTEVDLLRQHVLSPHRLVDINRLPLAGIEELPDGGLRIGALTRMSEVAAAPAVRRRFPFVARALELGASAQLRHMASMGGNMMQKVRCGYYRDAESRCNKRLPGSGCAALGGVSRTHAILGTSEHCIATHPSDVAVPLAALDARIHTRTLDGAHTYDTDAFFLAPGDTPDREHPLTHGELITAIEVPALAMAERSLYLKVRDRESYEFALVSVAAALDVEDGVVKGVRIALGGVGTRPWRARRAEDALVGAVATAQSFDLAARAELGAARTTAMNAFKPELARRTLVRALETLTRDGSR
ncbi:xanthine dehydrogenase family protein subunit M [Streptomyces spectabilis]|uniref:Xanthine dehydrogenase YagS FAD-binding subunit n=1 Tax=Streptomyces spectabilis TaxID=68270 RepID=A0A5P2XMI7_STRST|nr:xanthine dehydrogenase family protein subunit M [Streptomyces spectabilis]MBB5102436.1 xanthine dehydrogenase YagS FAD-binding subunit [Streptomyces spectabilis]MCI3907478.1 xanthine dehydrogenase family protein subunit M [Streptomyces spectabilis]QEV64180.1 xanthine dehydrogenase family protein subunit M [Streptomyces spectabilis]GGV31841.1 carbon-monoxide dehydrogenase medium subunit [Streptomyces spectabilis]